MLTGLGAIWLQFALFCGAFAGMIDEPFANVWAYLYDASMIALIGAAVTLPLVGLIAAAVLASGRKKPLTRMHSAVFLAPLPLSIPVALWSVAEFAGQTQVDGFTVFEKPEWFSLPAFGYAESPWWLLPAAIWIGLGLSVGLKAARLTSPPVR